MKTNYTLFSLVLLLFTVSCFSQSIEKVSVPATQKNHVGIQYSPFYDGNQSYIGNLFSVRYGYKISKPLIFGAELSGYFTNKNYAEGGQFFDPAYTVTDHYSVSANIFIRYSIPSDKRVQIFLEVSPYSHMNFTKPVELQSTDLFIYAAPGVSLFSKNKKMSVDLYYKYSTQTFYNTSHGMLSYKLNIHF
jgi:hypothetical protein